MNDEKDGCKFCDRVWGVMGIGLGVLITLIGFDLLSGGFVSKLIGTPKVAIESDDEIEDEVEVIEDDDSDDE